MVDFNIQRFAGGGYAQLENDTWFYFVSTVDDSEIDGLNYGTSTEDATAMDTPFWGFCPAPAEYTDSTAHGGAVFSTEQITLKVYGLASLNGTANAESGMKGVEGSATAITATAAGELSDILVEGDGKTNLTITIDGVAYPVRADGRIVDTLPAFGLMSKSDKQKLNSITPDTLLTKTEASDTYVTKAAAIVSGELTADGFVLINALGNGVVTIPAQA